MTWDYPPTSFVKFARFEQETCVVAGRDDGILRHVGGLVANYGCLRAPQLGALRANESRQSARGRFTRGVRSANPAHWTSIGQLNA